MVRLCLGLPYPFFFFLQVFVLFSRCVGVTLLVFGFLSEGVVLCVAVDSVCLMRGGQFRSLPRLHLELKPHELTLYHYALSFSVLDNALCLEIHLAGIYIATSASNTCFYSIFSSIFFSFKFCALFLKCVTGKEHRSGNCFYSLIQSDNVLFLII